MSRAYRIRWKTAERVVRTEDQATLDVDLLPILAEGDMLALLRDALAAEGWTRNKDGTLSGEVEDATATLSKDGATVTITLASEQKVTGRGSSENEAESQASRAADSAKAQLDEQTARKLARVEGSVRERVQSVVQKVYRDALEKKARSLGDVESIVENQGEDGELEITIKVKA